MSVFKNLQSLNATFCKENNIFNISAYPKCFLPESAYAIFRNEKSNWTTTSFSDVTEEPKISLCVCFCSLYKKSMKCSLSPHVSQYTITLHTVTLTLFTRCTFWRVLKKYSTGTSKSDNYSQEDSFLLRCTYLNHTTNNYLLHCTKYFKHVHPQMPYERSSNVAHCTDTQPEAGLSSPVKPWTNWGHSVSL